MGGALWALNKVWCEKGLFANSDKKRFMSGWKNQIKSLCADILASHTPGDISLLPLVTAYGHRITY